MPLLTGEFIGKLCEIKTLDHMHMGITRITNIFNGDSVELAALDSQERMPVVYYRTRVKLIVHLRGVHIFEGLVYLSNNKFMRVEKLKTIQDTDRRNAFRVETNAAAVVTSIHETDGKASPVIVEFDASVVDISLTGMRLDCHAPLICGETYHVTFVLSDYRYTLPVQVRRMYQTKQGHLHYGVSFAENAPQRQMDVLSREIMRLHRHTLKKRLRRR